jgi:HPt (histidine-containing phosphotransfer) domain-containing protein
MREDMNAYRIKVHSMKSSAAIIGIVPLAGMAAVLEKAAAEGNEPVIEKLHDVFISQWRSYKDKLRELVHEEDEEKPAGDNALLLTHIERMDTAIDEYDVNEAEDIFEKIDEYSYEPAVQELLEKLRSAIEQYDMDMAKEIAAQIKEILYRGSPLRGRAPIFHSSQNNSSRVFPSALQIARHRLMVGL